MIKSMEQTPLKNVNNCWNYKTTFCSKASVVQNSSLYLTVVYIVFIGNIVRIKK